MGYYLDNQQAWRMGRICLTKFLEKFYLIYEGWMIAKDVGIR